MAAARSGAAFLGVCSPWMSLSVESGAGASHVRTQNPVLAAGTPGARLRRVLAGPGHDSRRRLSWRPSSRPLTAPVSRTSTRPASTPVVTARWVRIQNGNRPRTRPAKIPEGRGPATRVRGQICFEARSQPTSTTGPAKREGMAPMEWPDATFEAVAVNRAYVDKTTEQRSACGSRASFNYARCPGRSSTCRARRTRNCSSPRRPRTSRRRRPCARAARSGLACLEGALERREPWGVWGGELLLRGTIVPRKRPRGRPRKEDRELAKADEQAA